MNPVLLAALINQVAVPELTRWLASRRVGVPLTDADILQKLNMDTDEGINAGGYWLAHHPSV